MEQVKTLLHELGTLVTGIAGSNTTKGNFACACAEVDLWEKIEAAVRIKASRARQLRNALLPIQQLPTEVVVRVLRMVVAPFREQTKYYTVLQQISRVCHRLRRIIHGTPTFWSRIDSSDPPHIVDRALKRSAAHALDVRYGFGISLDIFVEKLTPHIGRCRKVEVEYYMTGLEDLKQFLALPAPRLEQLVLRNTRPIRGFDTLEIFFEQATRLKEVEIRGVPCRWEAATFRGLESLRISGAHFHSFNQILRLLYHSTSLVVLELDGGINHASSADIDPTFRQINLPLLRNLSISFNHLPRTETFFDCIRVPSCTDLYLAIPDLELDTLGHMARLATLWLGQVQVPIPNPRSINIAMTSSITTLSVSSNDGQGRLSLALAHCYLYPHTVARVVEGVNRVIADHLVTSESSLQFDNSTFIFLNVQSFLNELLRLPSVTRLDIGIPISDYDMLPSWTAEECWTFPLFPSLKLLRLFHQPEEWILHIIRALFLSPALGIKNRVIDVEVYFRTEEEREHFPSDTADTIKEAIGEGNGLSFMLAPSE
ncbi:hypothetical protein FRC00_000678 [Tulasnella sp. 408]|nr:hypothetical protein FRC00_000678 [Tulasnella sp. 408]